MEEPTRLLDIVNRSLTGPIIDEATFDKEHVTEGIARVVKKYEIHADRETLVNQDDELADRVWLAALDFLATCGVYCQSTKRVLQFSREEIENFLKQAPDRIEYGAGDDQRLEVARKVEDPRVPMLMGSSIGSPIPENLFVPVMQSYIQEPLVDVTCAASIETVFDREIRTASPLEILACWREVDLMNEALEKAGRPGLAWTGVIMSMSDVGQLSSVNPAGLRQTDLFTFGVISELKTNFDILNKIAHAVRLGYTIDPYANPIYGGLGGGIDGQAVLITAAMVALSVFFMAVMVGSSPTHPFHFNDTGKELLLAQSLAFQALARNSHLMTNLTITPVGGPGTKTLLYECVAYTVMSTVSGQSRILGPRSATGSISRHFSGLEARFTGELLHAAVKLNRENAEEITQLAYGQYADLLDKKPYGKPFQEVYDVKSVQPTKEWLKIYDEVKEEAASWGLDFG
jgi:methylamine--corrinoid protein Co-methyltransferase